MEKDISPKLETHRFQLSENQEIRERLKKLRDRFVEIKKDHPEIAFCTVYGSNVKGDAENESDLDLKLYIDLDKLGSKKSYLAKSECRSILENAVIDSGFPKAHIDVGTICRDMIYYIDPKEGGSHSETIADSFFLSLHPDIKEYRKMIIDEIESQCKEYHKDPDESWAKIVDYLREWEAVGSEKNQNGKYSDIAKRSPNLYPQTLEEAKNKYLRGD